MADWAKHSKTTRPGMNDTPETPGEPRHRHPEYEDNHYHDDDEIVPADDGPPRLTRPVGKRKPIRRPPPRRPAYDDD
jgi:hypothetical protein